MEIRVKIDREEDLYDAFDADELTLNTGFVRFMKDRFSHKNDLAPTTVRFLTSNPIDEARFHQAIVRFCEEAADANERARRRNNLSMAYLFALGVAFIVAGILLKNANAVYLQIFSLTAGFAIKEAATIFFIKKPANRMEKRRIQALRRSNYVVELTDRAKEA